MHRLEFAFALKKLLRYYSELHAKKMCERRQALITQFMEPSPPPPTANSDPQPSTSQEPQPSTSQEAADLFDEDVVTNVDFDGFLAEAAAPAASEAAFLPGPSTSDGERSQ